MREEFAKKETYEFCEIKNTMVRLEVIQSTAILPDQVHAEAKLVPVSCNRQEICRQDGFRCIVYDPDGQDPCPSLWKSGP